MSPSAASSSRFACPRTISTGRRAASSLHTARPRSTRPAAGFVELRAAGGDLAAHRRARLGQRAAGETRGDEVARLLERARRRPPRRGRRRGSRPAPSSPTSTASARSAEQRHEAHLRKARLAARDHDHPRGAGKVRQQRADRLQRLLDRPGLRQPPLDRGAFLGARLGDLHHPVDEQPQPALGRHAPGAGMRRGEQPERFELGQHRADRSRRKVERRARPPASSSPPAARCRDSPRPRGERFRARAGSAR